MMRNSSILKSGSGKVLYESAISVMVSKGDIFLFEKGKNYHCIIINVFLIDICNTV